MIVDSDLDLEAALLGVSPDCPTEILTAQTLISVGYTGPEGAPHRGQIVIHEALADDVTAVFGLLSELGFPVASAIPLADPRFVEDGIWSDDRSMAANNASGFNYRKIAGTDRLSHHATGRALDINPLWNPMYRDGVTYPPAGTYEPGRPGTFHESHPAVAFLEERGWEWGGRWESPWDLHHFQKP